MELERKRTWKKSKEGKIYERGGRGFQEREPGTANGGWELGKTREEKQKGSREERPYLSQDPTAQNYCSNLQSFFFTPMGVFNILIKPLQFILYIYLI